MKCKICQSELDKLYQNKILSKYDVFYFHCQTCHFIQMEEEFWLGEAYQDSINLSDTGYMQRNIVLSKVVTAVLTFFYSGQLKCLDYAGGYGVFVRLMRDIGFDFSWQDKYTENLFARGFEFEKSAPYDLISSFESFEHFDRPLEEIEYMLSLADSILFSTVLSGKDIPAKDWHYYGPEHGQHISFYNIDTLRFLAKKYKLQLVSDRKSIHLFSKKKCNPLLFFLVVKLARLGLGDLLSVFKTSKTLNDWKLMRRL